MDGFSKICLLLIVVLLAVISLRSLLAPQSAEAAHRYKYTVATVLCQGCTPQTLLDKYSKDGWEFVAAMTDGQFIFRK
jgi:hypothetical protein